MKLLVLAVIEFILSITGFIVALYNTKPHNGSEEWRAIVFLYFYPLILIGAMYLRLKGNKHSSSRSAVFAALVSVFEMFVILNLPITCLIFLASFYVGAVYYIVDRLRDTRLSPHIAEAVRCVKVGYSINSSSAILRSRIQPPKT